MSEFSIDEKANAYDLALNKAKTLLSKCKRVSDKASMIYRAEDIENIFPELQKTNDEKIKEALIALVKCNERCGYTLLNNVSTSSMLTWIEKQGKQTDIANKEYWRGYREGKQETLDKYAELEKQGKEIQPQSYLAPKSASQAIKEIITDNANKVEPKFKVGDWVSNGACTWRIDLIEDDLYCNNCDKFTCGGDIKSIDEQYHLWTIKDAKDGDVLCVNNEIFIYAHKKQMYPIAVAHCFVDSAGGFYLGGEFVYREYGKTICPSTKEQRDLLFQKMQESGYEWNSYKKELINIL